MGIKQKTLENSWYCNNARPKQQIALYSLFVKKKKIPVEDLIKYVEEYRISKIPVRELSNHEKDYYTGNGYKKFILDIITGDFDNFLKIVSRHTGIKFKKNPKYKRKENAYDEWWNEHNLDGSFAYNGVTDDF